MKRNMHISASARIFDYASQLRKETTLAEKIFWQYLRARQLEGEKFRRQHPLKKFVLDFYCYKLRLGIELDGKSHLEPSQQFYDCDRTEILEGYELHILRFTNQEIINTIEIVLDKIRKKILQLRNNRQ